MNSIDKVYTRQKNLGIVVFVITFLLCLTYAILRGKVEFIYDSAWYCTIANGVIDNRVHLYAFLRTFRGCLLPIFIQLLEVSPLGIGISWVLLSSLMSAVLFSLIIPKIISDRGIYRKE